MCVYNVYRARERGVLVRGETRHTHCVLGAAAAVSTSRRAAAQPALILLHARGLVRHSVFVNHSLYIYPRFCLYDQFQFGLHSA